MGNLIPTPIKFMGSTRDMCIKKEDSDKIKGFLNLDHEVGGCMRFNCKTNKLEISDIVDGKGSSIDIDICKFEFHCHPNPCKTKSACHLGVPSGSDMKNIAERSGEGNCLHIVFAHEGMYACSCAKMRKELDSREFEERKHNILNKLKKEQDRFYGSGNEYPYILFQKMWMNIVNSSQSVFRVQYIPRRLFKTVNALDLIAVDEACWTCTEH